MNSQDFGDGRPTPPQDDLFTPRVPRGLLDNLNPEQYAAVTLGQEPALILAGAGSGKTRVLTTRIAWLIQTGQLSPGAPAGSQRRAVRGSGLRADRSRSTRSRPQHGETSRGF